MFRIIYSIYDKYRDESEADRVILEETIRVKGLVPDSHISQYEIRRGISMILQSSDEEESEHPRRKKK